MSQPDPEHLLSAPRGGRRGVCSCTHAEVSSSGSQAGCARHLCLAIHWTVVADSGQQSQHAACPPGGRLHGVRHEVASVVAM